MILQLTDDQLKTIRNTCPRSQAEIDQDIAIVRHWLDKQPHLPKTSDEIIYKMLFSLKFRTEKVKLVLENYYTIKDVFPGIYGNLDPTTDTFRKHVDAVYMFPLPKLTPDLSRVLCYRMATTDAKAFCMDSQLKRNEMIWNWCFEKDPLTLSNVWIFDLTNMDTMAQWAHFNISFMKRVLKINLESKPVRIKKVHFVNVSPIAETTLNFIKHFAPQKFRDRLIFSSSFNGLQEYYPTEMFPNEWGGKAGHIEELNQRMQENLIKSKNWCIEMEHKKVDSSKRIGESKITDQSIMGIEGNFKKINFD
ncbi:Cellular retinaldehyde binding/alpha-tocopherol transport,CRAL/TRIO, N-terminal domain,CRAL-TRIO lipid [Cinara cedri]|uniref:Cellular retinaldehyde binding/alpha-tocopherol transport,CRAL/TRIO, N-terminal domain,CRAL-TRIO lipid n=1 Tax=Cinara cedri TaxID=506608 RepID=A0A5E4MXK2_9HEMI|nr:Cellular retinaldehyde binding/alpha-tocopherol transport,CRAL/TRIO, N-terminal domain,CRAL-TRIO lipid [Cinara cedri]